MGKIRILNDVHHSTYRVSVETTGMFETDKYYSLSHGEMESWDRNASKGRCTTIIRDASHNPVRTVHLKPDGYTWNLSELLALQEGAQPR